MSTSTVPAWLSSSNTTTLPLSIPKIRRPKLKNAFLRSRLLDELESNPDQAVVWIHGPPGCGKTTLIASFVDQSEKPVVWYQVDTGDADPATLFNYLMLAATHASRRKSPLLPRYVSENATDLFGFARLYFRALLERLPQPSFIVLDDFHSVSEASQFAELIRILADELPDGVQLLIASRSAPCSTLARLQAAGRLTEVSGDALRLTHDEARAIAKISGYTEALPDAWLDSLEGWAAGLILMLGHPTTQPLPLTYDAAARSTDKLMQTSRQPQQHVFNYFAGEVLNSMSARNQSTLMMLALLPTISVKAAQQLCEDSNVGLMLADLYAHHYFTYRQAGIEATYKFHALFREFLLEKAQTHFSEAQWRELTHRAAGLLEAGGQPQQAIALYRQVGDWPVVRRLILENAPRLMARSQWQTLIEWTEALPSDLSAQDAWLLHWKGIARAMTDPAGGRQILESAFEEFVRADDRVGQLKTVAAIIESHQFEGVSYLPLDRWIRELERLIENMPLIQDASVEMHVWSLVVFALHARNPDHRLMDVAIEKVDRFLLCEIEPNMRVAAATYLLESYNWKGDYDKSRKLILLVSDLLRHGSVSDLNDMRWRRQHGYFLHTQGEHEAANAAFTRAREAAARGALSTADIDRHLYNYELVAAIGNRDTTKAQELIRLVEPLIVAHHHLGVAYLEAQKARLALLQGDFVTAYRRQEAALDEARNAGLQDMEQVLFMTVLAICLAALGDYARAGKVLDEADARTSRPNYALAAYRIDLVRVHINLKGGATDINLLRDTLAAGARGEFYNVFRWLPEMMSALLTQALALNMETEFVRKCIRVCAFTPADPHDETWPWPVKIRLLGPFSLTLNGVDTSFGGKAQKKPLELLKALVALGGQAVDPVALSFILWPDKIASKNLFDNTLFRLRKLLEIEDAILTHEGKLTLNPDRIWVDVWAFEHQADHISAMPGHGAKKDDDACRAADLLRIYHGHFLEGNPASAWLLPLRTRLQSKFQRHVSELGAHCEKLGQWHAAIALYQRCVELDSLAEKIYRRLMFCHIHLGDHAEAINAYRQCREMLSVVLGVKPAQETERLYRKALEKPNKDA